jgi:hypothetical protein
VPGVLCICQFSGTSHPYDCRGCVAGKKKTILACKYIQSSLVEEDGGGGEIGEPIKTIVWASLKNSLLRSPHSAPALPLSGSNLGPANTVATAKDKRRSSVQ